MTSTLARLSIVGGAIAVAVACRRQLVGLLTATTGTWVGSPAPPSGRHDS